MMVWTAFILVSYSWKPEITGSSVKALTMFLPAVSALFVIRDRAVAATTWRAEKLTFTLSTELANWFISTFLVAAATFSRPLDWSLNLRADFNRSIVDMDCLTFDSNCPFSNRISTTRSSICLPNASHLLPQFVTHLLKHWL